LEDVSSTRQYGLSRPEWIVRIFREGNQDIEVHFSSPNKDQYVAYCPDSKIVAKISETSFNNLKVNTEEFVEQETGTE
jgi:hypothetical protein